MHLLSQSGNLSPTLFSRRRLDHRSFCCGLRSGIPGISDTEKRIAQQSIYAVRLLARLLHPAHFQSIPDTIRRGHDTVTRRGNSKRQALAASAAELFWIRGFAATSIADIADKAQVPLGNVYYYYKSKADLAQAVADIFVGETEAMIDAITAETSDPRQRLSGLVDRLSRSMRSRVDHGCPIALCARDFRRDQRPASERAAESFALLIGFAARELGRLGIRPSVALGMARSAISEWQGGIALAHALGDATILSESFRRMEHILLTPPRG